MKPDQMVMAASLGTQTEGCAVAEVATNTHTAFDEGTHDRPAASGPRLVPTPASARPHTLILTGELDRSTARALEAEIERLCEEGVTGITLDLRGLTYIDSVGVAVIVFRCGLCKRRGYDFSLVPGSPFIQRVFERAGVTELLPVPSG